MWERWEAIRFLEERADAHYSNGLSECTSEEMWERPTQWAVFGFTKSGGKRKRATRVFDNRSKVAQYLSDAGAGKYSVEERPGERVRCSGNFCGVADYCAQWKEFQQQEGE